jgi:hypothetical protein
MSEGKRGWGREVSRFGRCRRRSRVLGEWAVWWERLLGVGSRIGRVGALLLYKRRSSSARIGSK